MNSSIILQRPLRLIVCKSEVFPDGNKAAFSALESHLDTLQGRKFYGLVYETTEGMDYFAGLVPEEETEEAKFINLGFSIREVEGGPCARAKLFDWSDKTDQIGPTVGEMIKKHGIDSSRPQIEFYRSLSELHLLLPIPSQDSLQIDLAQKSSIKK